MSHGTTQRVFVSSIHICKDIKNLYKKARIQTSYVLIIIAIHTTCNTHYISAGLTIDDINKPELWGVRNIAIETIWKDYKLS